MQCWWPADDRPHVRRVLGTYQAGFTNDADKDATSKDRQVLKQESGGHDQPCCADKQRHEEVPDAGQLMQAVFLLVR